MTHPARAAPLLPRRRLRPALWLLLATLPAACAPAPLYTGNRLPKGAVVGGEVPRDARGEPVWSAIKPPLYPPANTTPADNQPAPAPSSAG